ncbi:MAG: substrate-binding domain-containing protein [Chitinophagaceae bacterium]|nr:substrate-binding domain-containing protein [Chitinophagaceae bacterium]
MKRYKVIRYLIIGFVFIISGCGDRASTGKVETTTSGSIQISVDESFRPVIDSQVQVFESLHPDAHITVHYKPEAECLKDLETDSIRMVIVTRGLSDKEDELFTKNLNYPPAFGALAYDAVAVVVNNKSKDTTFTMQDIRSVAQGTSGYKYKMLLDGTTSTSTVRFVTDSLLKGRPVSKNVVAAKNSEAVIDYVSANNDAIGLIGVSWVGNKNDPKTVSFLDKVKVAAIECRGFNGTYIKPYQGNIAGARYPMVRTLYYILKENYDGVGSGFSNFLIYEKGQLIFKSAYLLPARMQFEVRDMNLSE